MTEMPDTVSPDETMIRFRTDSDDIAILEPERKRSTQLDPGKPWALIRGGARSGFVGEGFFRGQSWTDATRLREVAALVHHDDRSPVRRLANSFLSDSIGNDQPRRDFYRHVYARLRSALGDHPTPVYDDLAAARVIDVTPTESALDGADVVLSAVRALYGHAGIKGADFAYLATARDALEKLHQRLQVRAVPEEQRAEECPNCSDPFHEGSLTCRRCGCIRPASSKIWRKD